MIVRGSVSFFLALQLQFITLPSGRIGIYRLYNINVFHW